MPQNNIIMMTRCYESMRATGDVQNICDPGTSKKRKAWLWDETLFGRALLDLQPRLAASADAQHRILGNLTLIPATERHRLAKA